MRVLLIEDDPRTSAFIAKGLRQTGYHVQAVADGEEGRALALTEAFDAAVIDLMLPSLDGLSIIAAMRHAGKRTPVLILSAKASVNDRVKGLCAGGDDYLTKPFSFSELQARLEALVRRATGQTQPTAFTVADLSVDLLAREVTRAGRRLELQRREFDLLAYLIRHSGHVVTKTMLMEHVWDFDFDPATNIVESRMSRLRAKVDAPFPTPLIHTLRGVGYVLKPPA